LSSIPEFDETQLAAARSTAWHQAADPVLTLEAARTWLTQSGFVLFAPRAAQLPAPAPSFVEATLGTANAAPTLAETQTARTLLARLVADGIVLPLNLLGIPGDSPDFVVSAQVFSFIFTLRGDKNWKQPPATSGAISVSPLGLQIHQALTERGALTAAELANEVGREVSETAILRSLTELWSQLRVIPLLQMDDAPTLWELTTRRFTKAIKAGANAGQPTALSALVSLYLAQALCATEEEIATFLSPLTARSRVREVLHALIGARQLETVAVVGKTLLHVPGTLPAFTVAVPLDDVAGDGDALPQPVLKPKKIGTGRIASFKSETSAAGEFRGKPAEEFRRKVSRPASANKGAAGKRIFAGGAKPTSRPPSKYAPRLDGKSEPARRPFTKSAAPRPSSKPAFDKPWDEEKPRAKSPAVKDAFTKFRKPDAEDRAPLGPREQAGLPPERRTPTRKATESFERKPYAAKPYAAKSSGGAPRFGDSKPRDARPAFGSKPKFGAKSAGKPSFGSKPAFGSKRPYTSRTTEDGEAPRATFKPRAYEAKDRKPYAAKSFGDKPAFGSKPKFGGKPAGKSSFGSKPSFGARPAFGAKRPYTPRTTEDGPAKPYAKKPYAAKSFSGAPKFGDDKPAFGKPAFGAKRPYLRKAEGDFPRRDAAPKRAYKSRAKDDTPFVPGVVERTLAKRPYKPRAADADKRPFNKDPWVPPTESSSGKPKRSFKGGPRKHR
jgi:hypothetical protein